MRFLHIENDPDDRELLRNMVLHTENWKYAGASTLQEGLALWEMEHPDVVIIDIGLPDASQERVLSSIQRMSAGGRCVIPLSGAHGQEIVNLCYQHGAAAFLNKNDLTTAQAFHDAVTKNLRRIVAKGLGSSPVEQKLVQIIETLYIGNGKPSVLARLEMVDEKLLGFKDDVREVKDAAIRAAELAETRRVEVDKQFSEVRGGQRWTSIISAIGTIGVLIVQWHAISMHEDPSKIKVPEVQSEGSDK